MFRNLGPLELLIIVVIILLLFGGKKIPEMMHGLGKGLNEFKKASSGGATDEAAKSDTPSTTAPKA